MIPSVAAISQQYAQFAPRGCRCCRWPRVCVVKEYQCCGSASARIQWTCKMCSNNIPISLAISSHLSVNNIINTITSVLTKYAANITQPHTHTGSKSSFNPKTEFQISMLIKMKMFLLTFPRPSFDHAVFSVRYECDGTVCSQCAAGVRLMRAAVGRVRVGPS